MKFQARETETERCPYCHDGFAGERVTCTTCRTPHHPACMEELGGCTVLGCPGAQARPESSVEEVRARLRERVRRMERAPSEPDAVGFAARVQGVHYTCPDCEVEFELYACPHCAGRLLAEPCGGSGVHCEREGCAARARALRKAAALDWSWLKGRAPVPQPFCTILVLAVTTLASGVCGILLELLDLLAS